VSAARGLVSLDALWPRVAAGDEVHAVLDPSSTDKEPDASAILAGRRPRRH